ncbi:MAG TPA: GGDEF domain-containing protein [Thermoanaerobaculia bacterium]|nr:GGDEF domain-containing protein [Thermoanaerobaculia bacterium]
MAGTDTRAETRTRRAGVLRRPGLGTWVFLTAVGLYQLVPAAQAAWNELAPRLPDAGPYALLLTGVLFGVGFHHARLSGLSLLLAADLWVLSSRDAIGEPDRALTVLLLLLNLAWIGLWPVRARLSWRWLAGLLLIAGQAAAAHRWEPTASAIAADLVQRTGGDGAAWVAAAVLLGLAPWLVRALSGGAGLPLTVLWSCASVSLAILSAGELSGRPVLYRWLAALLVLVALAEASYRLAYIDELTGLPGRRALIDALAPLRGDYALGVVDIDHFKSFNDRHGHDVGDQVLRRVASELGTVVCATAYRLGGEEFALIFARGSSEAEAALERLRRQISEGRFTVRAASRPRTRPKVRKPPSGRLQRRITVSIGLAASTARDRRAEEVLRRADAALYRAKRGGRNRLVVAGRRPKAPA